MWSCSKLHTTRSQWWDVNIDSGNGLVPDGTKPLPESMFTQNYVGIWRHQATMSYIITSNISSELCHLANIMMTSSIGKIFALLAICEGNSPVTGEFPAQRPVTRSFDVLYDLRLNKRLSEPSWGCWFETPSRPLWRHSNDFWSYYRGTLGPVLLTFLRHVARISANGIAAFKESCNPIG